VILDISMPVASGLDAAARMSAGSVPPRIVFLTVHEASEFVAAARDAGACAYVFKRSAFSDLIPAVSRALAGECTFPEFAEEAQPVPEERDEPPT
jgi:DNA-binding NarL/FixJ family response regulator